MIMMETYLILIMAFCLLRRATWASLFVICGIFLFDGTDPSLLESLSLNKYETVPSCASNVLPLTKLAEFKKKQEGLKDLEILEQTDCQNNFRIQRTVANIVLKVHISDSCVERAFSRHKLVNNNLAESLSA